VGGDVGARVLAEVGSGVGEYDGRDVGTKDWSMVASEVGSEVDG